MRVAVRRRHPVRILPPGIPARLSNIDHRPKEKPRPGLEIGGGARMGYSPGRSGSVNTDGITSFAGHKPQI